MCHFIPSDAKIACRWLTARIFLFVCFIFLNKSISMNVIQVLMLGGNMRHALSSNQDEAEECLDFPPPLSFPSNMQQPSFFIDLERFSRWFFPGIYIAAGHNTSLSFVDLWPGRQIGPSRDDQSLPRALRNTPPCMGVAAGTFQAQMHKRELKAAGWRKKGKGRRGGEGQINGFAFMKTLI